MSEFPRESNSLLTEEEKTFLDDAPQKAVALLFDPEYAGADICLDRVTNDGFDRHEFKGERAKAVLDYYEMLFHFGVREDARVKTDSDS